MLDNHSYKTHILPPYGLDSYGPLWLGPLWHVQAMGATLVVPRTFRLRSAYVPPTFCLRSATLLAFDITLCSSESAAYAAPTFRVRSAYVPQKKFLLLGYTPMRIRTHQHIHLNTHQESNATLRTQNKQWELTTIGQSELHIRDDHLILSSYNKTTSKGAMSAYCIQYAIMSAHTQT